MSIVIIVQSQSNLFEIVFALRPTSCFACLLYSGQQQGNQYGDNRNHYQQLNQCKPQARL